MLLLGDVHRCICLKFFMNSIRPKTVIVNNFAREQFNWANATWMPCGCHSHGVCDGSHAVLPMRTCVVQLRLHIFYLLLKSFIFGSGSSGSGHVILALHAYVGQLSLFVFEFCLQILIVDFLYYNTFSCYPQGAVLTIWSFFCTCMPVLCMWQLHWRLSCG